MRTGIFLNVILFFILSACSSSISSSVRNNENKNPAEKDKNTRTAVEKEEVWTPTAVEQCLSKTDVGEPFKVETSFNPFYLRADLDGNELIDYAVLVKGQNTKKRGVVICQDAKRPFVFGSLSKPKKPLSSFEDDNFITGQWEVSTKEFTKTNSDPSGRKISPDAKGESIAFIFEGGNGVNIYWDGKEFQVAE